jgi:Arc/MetJ-type ribon-helix-helix transcriptional regulator
MGNNVISSINFRPDQHEKLGRLVEARRYRSLSEAVRAGVDLLLTDESEIIASESIPQKGGEAIDSDND